MTISRSPSPGRREGHPPPLALLVYWPRVAVDVAVDVSVPPAVLIWNGVLCTISWTSTDHL
jgi:hypothetical protein